MLAVEELPSTRRATVIGRLDDNCRLGFNSLISELVQSVISRLKILAKTQGVKLSCDSPVGTEWKKLIAPNMMGKWITELAGKAA
mmetsp:Transcript_19011/g.38382  ORF Transcript_19011/g.38382 Transcript_19011/m.38382 type:complete len:85 (+) Transcript_19011:1248-1502(+)